MKILHISKSDESANLKNQCNSSVSYYWTNFIVINHDVVFNQELVSTKIQFDLVVIELDPLKECNWFKSNFALRLNSQLLEFLIICKKILSGLLACKVIFVLKGASKQQNLNFVFNNALVTFVGGLKLETDFLKWDYCLYFYQQEFSLIKLINEAEKIIHQKKFIYGSNEEKISEWIINRKYHIPSNTIENNVEKLQGKVVVITGASGGIGKSIAYLFAACGCHVYSLSRKYQEDKKITFLPCDITSYRDVKAKIDTIWQKEKHIDIFINNSGYGISGSVENVDITAFSAMQNVNFFAQINTLHAVISYLIAAQGIILNVGSMGGIFPLPFQVGYSVSKKLIDVYSELIAPYLNEKGVTICNIMPGDTKTSFTANRSKKDLFKDDKYAQIALASIAYSEREEQNGHSPEKIAKLALRMVKKKKMPLKATVGKYCLFFLLARLLKFQTVLKLLQLILVKHEPKK